MRTRWLVRFDDSQWWAICPDYYAACECEPFDTLQKAFRYADKMARRGDE